MVSASNKSVLYSITPCKPSFASDMYSVSSNFDVPVPSSRLSERLETLETPPGS